MTFDNAYIVLRQIICQGLRRPVFIWGPPRMGKSALVYKIGRDLGYEVITFDLILREPVELRGAPSHIRDHAGRLRTVAAPPLEVPLEDDDINRRIILFLDEFPQAHPSVQAVASMMLSEHRIAEHRLHPSVYIIAAGNRLEDRAATYTVPSHVLGRCIHIDLDQSSEEWLRWGWQAGLHPFVLGFIHRRPDMLIRFDPEARSYPMPGTWHMLSDVLYAIGVGGKDGKGSEGDGSGGSNMGSIDSTRGESDTGDKSSGISSITIPDVITPGTLPDLATLEEVFCGIIGDSAASEFGAFITLYKDLPSPEDILYRKASIPEEPDVMCACISACVAHYRDNPGKHAEAFCEFANRLPIEYATTAITMALSCHDEPSESPIPLTDAFNKFADRYVNLDVRARNLEQKLQGESK